MTYSRMRSKISQRVQNLLEPDLTAGTKSQATSQPLARENRNWMF